MIIKNALVEGPQFSPSRDPRLTLPSGAWVSQSLCFSSDSSTGLFAASLLPEACITLPVPVFNAAGYCCH